MYPVGFFLYISVYNTLYYDSSIIAVSNRIDKTTWHNEYVNFTRSNCRAQNYTELYTTLCELCVLYGATNKNISIDLYIVYEWMLCVAVCVKLVPDK